jgi:hypothetical protein
MKGLVFTEFLEMVEAKFSANMVDDIIEDCVLESGGAYTAVGTYDHHELVLLVTALSQRSGVPGSSLVLAFGEYMFQRFRVFYPGFFTSVHSALDLLEGIESVIHTEVRKLYPDAQLPKFDCVRSVDGLTMDYSSPRHFGDLAEGLIRGAIAHFGDKLDLSRETRHDGTVRFTLRLLS